MSKIYGVFRTAKVLIDGSITDEWTEVTDLMTYRNTKRDAAKIAAEWNTEATNAGSTSIYFVKVLD